MVECVRTSRMERISHVQKIHHRKYSYAFFDIQKYIIINTMLGALLLNGA